jgi:hypothetical protein
MNQKNILLSIAIVTAVVLSVLILSACSTNGSPTSTPTPPPSGGGTVVRSDSIITGEIRDIREQTTGYPWAVDVLVQSSDNVDNLSNPTIDKVGQVITAKTDENMSSFKVGQVIAARVKYVGDVPQPGISLYMYNIEAVPAPDEFSLGQEFSLSVGQSAAVSGEDLTIKFIEVTSDSRCPQDVTCIWAGEVSCLIEVAKGSLDAYKLVLTQPGLTDQTATQDFDGYEIMFRVDPYPTAGKQITKDEYRLVMTVTKSTQSNVEIGPAPIDDVKIAVTLSQPQAVLVYIKGGLRNTCTTFADLNTERIGNVISIEVNVQTITGQICGQVYTFFERCVDLGSDFVSGQVYTITVNDKTTTFTMP